MQCRLKNYIVGYYIEYTFNISQITDLLVCYCHLVSLMRQYLQEKKYNVYRTIATTIMIIITLDNDAHKSVRYTFNFVVLCYYDDYPFIHGNADIKHLSGDYIMH